MWSSRLVDAADARVATDAGVAGVAGVAGDAEDASSNHNTTDLNVVILSAHLCASTHLTHTLSPHTLSARGTRAFGYLGTHTQLLPHTGYT